MSEFLNRLVSKMQEIYHGDCLEIMKGLKDKSVDMIYLDPPFFTNKKHSLSSRDRKTHYSFDDLWDSHKSYAEFMLIRIIEARRILRDTGSILDLLAKMFSEKKIFFLK